jgi:serine/threonine protein kinase
LGPVFRAYEPERDRLVAVKVFRLDLPPERVHQLVDEFERLIDAGLRHPAIATPVATGLNGVVAYLAQDFFSGDSLDIVLRENGPMSIAEALRVARQLGEALDFAAERQVEHGALNPRDVLLSPETACIAGFGITRALEHIGAATPIRRPYTSPERLTSEAWDRRADVFSLAAVVYEMLWGRRLVGTGMQAMEAMTLLPGTHLTALQAAFASALAEQPVDRFATALEFVESLEHAASPEMTTVDAIDIADAGRLAPDLSESLHIVPPRRFDHVEPMLPLEDETPEHEPGFASAQEPVLEMPEPEPALEILNAEPALDIRGVQPLPDEPEPAASPASRPVAPPFLTPSSTFLSSTPSPAPSSTSSLVWPIGLACLVGIASGFGVGYTVGMRDRASVSLATATGERPSAPTAPATPPDRTFTESTVDNQPAAASKPANEPRLPPLESAPVVPFSGRVVVRSTPAGARVFVDGRDRGAAPATVTGLGQGEHRIRIVHDGYTTAERRVVLSPERPSQTFTVPLAKAPVAPKATGSQTAKSPVVTPKPGASEPAKADEAGLLVLDSRPTGATVFLDGRVAGKTPLSVPDVKAGDHTVRFELSGHYPWTASINVVSGTSTRVGGSLEKID